MTRVVVAALLAMALAGACTASASGPSSAGSGGEHGGHGEGQATVTPSPSASPLPAQTAAPTATATTSPTPSAAPTAVPDTDGVVEITMTDAMRFEPAEITVRAGDTIRFVVSNVGVVQHEAVIGTPEEQRQHAEEMAAGDVHYHSNGVLVDPGETDAFETWFPAGQYLIACHLPGHYEAGMVGLLNVVES